MTVFSRLGRALRFLRERQGRSQKEVAAAANITPPMLSAYENERAMPEIETLDRILGRGLSATLEELRWAIDVVNDRATVVADPARPTRPAFNPIDRNGTAARGMLAPSPNLEQACSEIAQGLLRAGQAMIEAVSESTRQRVD